MKPLAVATSARLALTVPVVRLAAVTTRGVPSGPVRTDIAHGLRDPFLAFDPPPLRSGANKPVKAPRPAGVRGLEVGQLRLQGIVQEEVGHTMIAMVTNGTNLSYFLHENQRLYDGVVTRITRSSLYLREDVSAAGRASPTREVILSLGPAGTATN